MPILMRLVAAYLVLVAVAVGTHFVITPLYHPGGDATFPVWEILNWFMAAGMIITVIAAFMEKRRTDGNPDADLKCYLETNAIFYGAITLFIVFFWNWFSNLDPDNVPDGQFWVVIDTVMPIVMGVSGCRLWRNAGT